MPKTNDATMFEVRAASDNTIDVLVYDYIGDGLYGGVSAKAVAEAIMEHKGVKTINVFINSPGGSVADAMAIYNTLSRHKARVLVYVDGMALSAASVIAMAGDEILMASNAMMMIHEPIAMTGGTADDLRSAADALDKVAGTIVGVYVARTGQDVEHITQMLADETWMTADEAEANGFADEIVEAKRVAAFGDLSKYRNLPDGFVGQVNDTHVASAGRTGAKKQEKAKMAEETKTQDQAPQVVAPVAVQFSELKAALKDASAEFRESCLEDGLTLEQAKDRWLAHLHSKVQSQAEELEASNAKRDELDAENKKLAEKKDAGGSAVNFGSDTDEGDGGFVAVAEALAEKKSINLRVAKAMVAKEQPELYSAYRETFRRQR